MIRKIEFLKKECHCGIRELYDLIAIKLGYDPKKVQYDCTKICVSLPVQSQIFDFYKEEKKSTVWIASNWLMYGPKANLPEDTYIAKIQQGFIEEVKK